MLFPFVLSNQESSRFLILINLNYIISYNLFVMKAHRQTPLLFLPLLVINGENDIVSPSSGEVFNSRDVARFGYSLIVMAIYWISECMPIAATALLPYVFYPLQGMGNGK